MHKNSKTNKAPKIYKYFKKQKCHTSFLDFFLAFFYLCHIILLINEIMMIKM